MDEVELWIKRVLQDLHRAQVHEVTAVLHGSAARGQYVHGWSDVNLLLIFTGLGPGVLERLGPALTRWEQHAKSAPLLFTRAEWARAADAYPLEIAEMRTGYRVFSGADPLAAVRVNPGHLRLALERELRGKLLQLRQGYAIWRDRPEALAEGTRHGLSSLLVLLRGMLVLVGRDCPADPSELIAAAAGAGGFDGAALSHMVSRRLQPGWKPDRVEIAGLIAVVERAAGFVDHFTHGEGS